LGLRRVVECAFLRGYAFVLNASDLRLLLPIRNHLLIRGCNLAIVRLLPLVLSNLVEPLFVGEEPSTSRSAARSSARLLLPNPVCGQALSGRMMVFLCPRIIHLTDKEGVNVISVSMVKPVDPGIGR
jgi:hypothetical protein